MLSTNCLTSSLFRNITSRLTLLGGRTSFGSKTFRFMASWQNRKKLFMAKTMDDTRDTPAPRSIIFCLSSVKCPGVIDSTSRSPISRMTQRKPSSYFWTVAGERESSYRPYLRKLGIKLLIVGLALPPSRPLGTPSFRFVSKELFGYIKTPFFFAETGVPMGLVSH